MVKNERSVLIVLIIFLIDIVFTQSQVSSAQLIFITNESFIINDSTIKILIDYDYRSIVNNEKYQNIQSPFDNINIISISHIHDDHFNKDLTVNYLEKTSLCNAIMPTDVYEAIKADVNNSSINDKISVINQKNYECIDKVIFNNKYKYIKVPHAAGIIAMENLLFIFTLGEIKFLHAGDYWGDKLDLIKCDLLKEDIDVALIHVKFLTNGDLKTNLDLIKQYINPKCIFLMHIPIGSERMEEALKAKEDLENEYKNIYIFSHEMETLEILKANNSILIK